MTYFVGILDGSDGAWGVRIPDMPGCNGGGATQEEAISDATSAMREWAHHVVTAGRDLPLARSIKDIVAEPENEFNHFEETTVMLPLILEKQRVVKANISLDAGTLEAIDAAADRAGLTRSSFLAAAAIEKIIRADNSAAAEARRLAPVAMDDKAIASLQAVDVDLSSCRHWVDGTTGNMVKLNSGLVWMSLIETPDVSADLHRALRMRFTSSPASEEDSIVRQSSHQAPEPKRAR